MNRKYIGITLGPILDTLELSSTPAGMWAASYLFSKMARDICQELLNSGIQETNFLSPYFELNKESMEICLPKNEEIDVTVLMKRGVGFFHDRIVYQVESNEQEEISKAQGCIEKVIDRICQSILDQLKVAPSSRDNEKHNLQKCFQIHTVYMKVQEGCAPMYSVSKGLDHIEKESHFWTNTERDYLWEILADNKNVRNSWMAKDLKDWQLIQDEKIGNVINIPEMARTNHAPAEKNKKKDVYFALVQADGDYMGEVVKHLVEVEDIRRFSKKCIIYAGKCVKLILEYGGIVIYAGGDDLLFMAPVESYKIWNGEQQERKKNILELLEELKDIFLREDFKNSMNVDKTPTLSIGLSIQYHKYPLYEALKSVSYLLFGVAKSKEKDCLAVQLRKHSGKSVTYEIPSLSKTKEIKGIAEIANQGCEEFLTSVLRHIGAYEAVFCKAIEEHEKSVVENVHYNLLLDADNKKEKTDKPQLNKLINILCTIMERENNTDKSKEIYTSILRYSKFFGEDREEGE